MSTPSSAASAKRMRLGTRSCAECRRRRVRCVFPTDSTTCEACALHDSPCQAQQPAPTDKRPPPAHDSVAMRKRLEELEAAVQELRGNASSSAASTPFMTNSSSGAAGSTRRNGSLYSESEVAWSSAADEADLPDTSVHAPLIELLKSAMYIETVDASSNRLPLTSEQRFNETVQTIKQLLPSHGVLLSILSVTEPYWPIWPGFFYGPELSDQLRQGDLEGVAAHISGEFASHHPPSVAKALLWTALCIQQLPLICDEDMFLLPAPAKSLVDSYMRTARTLLEACGGHEQTIVTIECLLFQYKLYINMGKPRKAWTCTQQGMTNAMLQGLHRLQMDATQRQKYVWSQIWGADVTTAMILGFPWSMSMAHPSLSIELTPNLPHIEIWYTIGKLAHAIVERDQMGQTADYSVTVRLDQDWERALPLLPEEWRNGRSKPELGFTERYYQRSLTAFFFSLRKLIHMPYMLKAQQDRRFEHSRVSAIDASKELMRAYCDLREDEVTERVFCELLDYQAFSAGLIIAVNHLTDPSLNTDANSNDWNLVERMIATLKRTSVIANCAVSEQGARILEILSACKSGKAPVAGRYEAIIPYFGTVRLSCGDSTTASLASLTSPDGTVGISPPSEEIDLNVDLFDCGNLPTFDIDSELFVDWAAIFE